MPAPTFETLGYALEDGIATVTLNRPDRMNAFNTTMMNELIAAFDHTDADDAVRAVIVTGAGRAYCAGADLSAGPSTFDYGARGGEECFVAGVRLRHARAPSGPAHVRISTAPSRRTCACAATIVKPPSAATPA